MEGEESVACSVCLKRYKNSHSRDSHIIDCHDGEERRVDKLVCPADSCGAEFQSRIRYVGHLGSKHAMSEAIRHLCPLCDEPFESAPELDQHLDDRHQQQEQDSTASQSDANIKAVQSLRSSLISHTGNINTADYLINMACPIVLSMESGERIAVLGVPEMAGHLLQKTIVHSEVSRLTGETGRTDIELSQALMVHHYGSLVLDRLKSYEQLGTTVSQRRYSEASDLARLLAGCLIHSQENVALVLKVELYGRSRTEDPHEQPLAFPAFGDYIVVSVKHGGAQKLLIGTHTWLALVTCCILLHSGVVVVGPHNRQFVPHKSSIVWINTNDMERNALVERQLRSKFHDDRTFLEHAGVFFLFRRPSCLPVTLRTLYEHYAGKGPSGIKSVALVFSRLFNDKRLPVEELVAQGTPVENTRINKELNKLQQMISNTNNGSNNTTTTVSEPVSIQLRVLAELATGVITALNHSAVKVAVIERIEVLLTESR
ncbi:MAG: hypothetical protein J3R72DRAFT_94012 [Linnemannia gamsii]|nr:MAG: hypothetical protein J3R72DRAFT_94012 [Linnemannia gamsii]